MKTGNQLYEELILFIRDEILGSDEQDFVLTRDMILEDDLGLTGIDAEKFIYMFSTKFDVNIQDFNIDDYFAPESVFFRSSKQPEKALTIGMLEEAIIAGVLK